MAGVDWAMVDTGATAVTTGTPVDMFDVLEGVYTEDGINWPTPTCPVAAWAGSSNTIEEGLLITAGEVMACA